MHFVVPTRVQTYQAEHNAVKMNRSDITTLFFDSAVPRRATELYKVLVFPSAVLALGSSPATAGIRFQQKL